MTTVESMASMDWDTAEWDATERLSAIAATLVKELSAGLSQIESELTTQSVAEEVMQFDGEGFWMRDLLGVELGSRLKLDTLPRCVRNFDLFDVSDLVWDAAERFGCGFDEMAELVKEAWEWFMVRFDEAHPTVPGKTPGTVMVREPTDYFSNAPSSRYFRQNTRINPNKAMILAARDNDVTEGERLIERGGYDLDGPLIVAADCGHRDFVRWAIEKGAETIGEALRIAARNNNRLMVEYLLSSEASRIGVGELNAALFEAIAQGGGDDGDGNFRVAEALLRSGADGRRMATAIAIVGHRVELFRFLIGRAN